MHPGEKESKLFQLPSRGWNRDRAGSRFALMRTRQNSHWGRCWSCARTFLRRAVFLGIAQKLMESQGGAKGFGIMGISHTSLSLCGSTTEVLSAERSIHIKCLFETVKFIPVSDDCPE